MMFSRSTIFAASGMMVSMESRAIMIGLVVFLMASAIAMVVMEFLDMSPAKIEKSASPIIFSSFWSFAKEPESVDSSVMIFESGGILFLKESGKMTFVRESGNLLDRNSAVLIGAEKDCSLPPMMLAVPLFCSGMFQSRLSKSGFLSCFCQ